MACRECHLAKVKCDKEVPCSRCVRLEKECVKHESRQGQGRGNAGIKKRSTPKKKRSRTTAAAASVCSRSNTSYASLSDREEEEAVDQRRSEDAAISAEVGSLGNLPTEHFGLRHLLRMFVAIALRRRNFGLMARAGRIADRNGITMDEILCESSEYRGMDFLYPVLLLPAAKQQVLGNGRLSWDDLPKKLLAATNCVGASDEEGNDVVAHRWIWIRETDQGLARFLATPAFERDVCSVQEMQDTYQTNKKSVIELFVPHSELSKHPTTLAHQVSLHMNPKSRLQPSRIKTKLKLKLPLPGRAKHEKIIDVDQIMCYAFQEGNSSDYGVNYTEYILPQEIVMRSKSPLDNSTNNESSNESSNYTDSNEEKMQGLDPHAAGDSELEDWPEHRLSFILELDLDALEGGDGNNNDFDEILDLIT